MEKSCFWYNLQKENNESEGKMLKIIWQTKKGTISIKIIQWSARNIKRDGTTRNFMEIWLSIIIPSHRNTCTSHFHIFELYSNYLDWENYIKKNLKIVNANLCVLKKLLFYTFNKIKVDFFNEDTVPLVKMGVF